MILFTLITFSAVVFLIAIVTHRINAPVRCDHDWKEMENGLRCAKCHRTISRNDRYLPQEVPMAPITDTCQVYGTLNPAAVISQHEMDVHLNEESSSNLENA